MAKFISLTYSGRSFRYNAAHIVSYWAHPEGGSCVSTTNADANSDADRVSETPEQIDAMLGVTENPAVAALDDLIGWVFKTHGEGWDSVTTPGPVVAACFALSAARGE
ncbi:hypothetical protein ACHMW5_13440 [Azospirillum melinis]|uniref:hypothetical protein n=1 Tax=Azospirillum melinis TaxID=328839 RepID=UPI003756EA43